jgi:hypothetical protein
MNCHEEEGKERSDKEEWIEWIRKREGRLEGGDHRREGAGGQGRRWRWRAIGQGRRWTSSLLPG